MKFVIDIDGTICTETAGEYHKAIPLKSTIHLINQLFENGHEIIYQTGRRWELLKLTKSQLESWSCKFHTLVMGKPVGDVYFDDRSVNNIVEFIKICDNNIKEIS